MKYALKKLCLTLPALAICFAFPLIASAQAPSPDSGVDIIPAKTVNIDSSSIKDHTHPPVKITPDKSELIRLEKDAATIIVGNPAHLSVLAESTKTLVLVPRTPGATHFTVLDNKGNVIMQRHAIVASPKKEYVRIRRTCAGSSSEGCAETSVFYCPGMCHEIAVASEASDSSAAASAAAAAEAASSAATPPAQPEDADTE